MANGQVRGLIDEELNASAAALARQRPLSKMPAFLRKPVVLSSRTVALVQPSGWMLYDALVAAAALAAGYVMSPRAIGLSPTPSELIVFALAAVVGGNIAGLYERKILLTRIRLLLSLGITTVIAVVGIALFRNLIVYEQIGRWILLIASVTFFVAAAAPRLVAHYAAHLHKLRVLLVGDMAATSPLVRRLRGEGGLHLFMGFCSENHAASEEALGSTSDIPRLCRALRIDEIVITSRYMHRPEVLDRCFEAMYSGCRVLDEASFYEEVFEEVPVNEISEGWFYTARLGGVSPFHIGLKRVLDILGAGLGLTFALPVLPVLWALVRFTSRGPVIYSQVRCGRFGKTFRMYKFRSMYSDAETNGAQWAEDRDPRVTPVGRFLRTLRLDEIPQFWNVLKGDMSLVGPRPERPELVSAIEQSVPYFVFRHLVRPGLTGLAQIRYRYGSSVDDARRKLQHDLYYIKNWSLPLDLQIILRTISALMKGSR